MAESNKCVVAIRTPSGNLVKAFDVRISGHDVYVIYSDCSVRCRMLDGRLGNLQARRRSPTAR